MVRIIFTLDYEIHGNGDGCPQDLMVEPTYRLLTLFSEYGAKLTIMADVAEILKFKEYRDTSGRDDYCYDAIVDQLRHAIKEGHDVQLHIHPSYFNARHNNGSWRQDWSEYNFAVLPYERMNWMIGTCKQFLETLLRPADPGYRCIAFRAANWSVTPSKSVVRALVNNGIKIDTSIFKFGRRTGMVTFDYSRAHSQIVPWRVKEDDICRRDDTGELWELPIYCEKRWLGAFLTPNRMYRAYVSRNHKVRRTLDSAIPNDKRHSATHIRMGALITALFRKHAWKADFNQCTGNQLIHALDRASRRHALPPDALLPFVLIGHSKLFTNRNQRDLAPFLAYAAQHSKRFTFDDLTGLGHSCI